MQVCKEWISVSSIGCPWLFLLLESTTCYCWLFITFICWSFVWCDCCPGWFLSSSCSNSAHQVLSYNFEWKICEKLDADYSKFKELGDLSLFYFCFSFSRICKSFSSWLCLLYSSSSSSKSSPLEAFFSKHLFGMFTKTYLSYTWLFRGTCPLLLLLLGV